MKFVIRKLRELYAQRGELRAQAAWVLAQGRPFTGRILLIFFIGVLGTVLSTVLTLLNKRLIDSAVRAEGSFDISCFVLVIALTAFGLVLGSLSRYFCRLIGHRFSTRVRRNMFERFLKIPWRQETAYHSGDILTRLTGDVGAVVGGLTQLIPSFFSLIVRALISFVILWRFDRRLALVALIIGPLCVLAGLVFTGELHDSQLKLKENKSAYRSFMQESVENAQILKAFEMEDDTAARYDVLTDERHTLIKQRGRIGVVMRLVMNGIFRSGYFIALGWGLGQLARGSITYGTLGLYLSMVGQISGPISRMGNIFPKVINVLTSAGRLMPVCDIPVEEKYAVSLSREAVGLRFEHVDFDYGKGPVLRDTSFEIFPGETVGLVGETGAGKTTIGRLLLGLIVPDAGKVTFFDGKGNTEPASPATRALIAYVPQGNTLRSGSLRENLVMNSSVSGDEALWDALRTASAEDFVRGLPKGLDTVIGEKGVGLSEGQAQRIAIARALLRNAPLLILDEASASLDMETESKIIDNINERSSRHTCLIITHRPSLLKLCSRCYRIKGGHVEECAVQAE